MQPEIEEGVQAEEESTGEFWGKHTRFERSSSTGTAKLMIYTRRHVPSRTRALLVLSVSTGLGERLRFLHLLMPEERTFRSGLFSMAKPEF